MSTQLMSLAEVLEMESGAWVNDGLTAVVNGIEQRTAKKSGKKFWVVKLGDTTGSAEAEMAMFTAPKFKEGQQIDLQGQGIKFEEGQYGPKISISGEKTEIHVVGTSVHHPEQQERKANLAPAVNGSPQQISGVSVGCAMNQAWETIRFIYTPAEVRALLKDGPAELYRVLKQLASDHLRVAAGLEHGKIAPPSWKQPEEPLTSSPQSQGRADPPPRTSAPRTPQNERQAANLEEGNEDVPF